MNIVSLVVVVFIMFVLVGSYLLLPIASICIILHPIGLQLQTLSFPHQLLFKKVILKISGAIYYFRVKIGRDYQNGLCVLVLTSEHFFQSVKMAR